MSVSVFSNCQASLTAPWRSIKELKQRRRRRLGKRRLKNEMLFLTNELAKEAEITILSARDTTRPGLRG